MNGDGKLDLVVADFSGGVAVLLGTGSGSFGAASTFSAGTNPQSVTTADVNGDGKLDLIVADRGSGAVAVLLGNGAVGGQRQLRSADHLRSRTRRPFRSSRRM